MTDSQSWPVTLEGLLAGGEMSAQTCSWAMGEIMSGRAADAQIAAFLTALRGKGVTGRELAHFVDVMLAHAVPVSVPGTTVDTCGTGGDNSGSVNISTLAAIVVAAAGRRVVKHGNRAASSLAGSADVLEELGVLIDLPPEQIAECVDRAGIAFCFAQAYHPAMRYAGPVRREIGIRTVLNFMGPMSNPARPAAQVLGVADRAMAPIVAQATAERNVQALIVRGEDGLDEITTLAPTRVWDCRGGTVSETVIDTQDLGIARPEPGSLSGGDARLNADLARAALAGDPGAAIAAIQDAVAVNAAAALLVADAADAAPAPSAGLVEQLAPYVATARSVLADGTARRTLDRWVEVTRELRPAG